MDPISDVRKSLVNNWSFVFNRGGSVFVTEAALSGLF
jgi:hypothetical protein